MAREIPENRSLPGKHSDAKKMELKTQMGPVFFSDCAILFGRFYRFYFIISYSTLSIQQMSSPLAAEWHHYCGILGATEKL